MQNLLNLLSGNTNPAGKGILSSEFLITAIAVLIGGLLVKQGLITPDAKDPIVQFLEVVAGAGVALAAQVTYNNGRVDIKKQLLQSPPPTVISGDTPVIIPVDTPAADAPAA